jgi:hypothetical protein
MYGSANTLIPQSIARRFSMGNSGIKKRTRQRINVNVYVIMSIIHTPLVLTDLCCDMPNLATESR